MSTDIQQGAAARISAAQQAVRTARAAFEQVIRDEVNSEAITPSDVARALGTKNRQRVYAILGRGPEGEEVPMAPSIPPVIYLRGAGCGDRTWNQVITAMHARGWVTIRDRTTAWHLARGGARVVYCDFSALHVELHSDIVRVTRVRAKYEQSVESALVMTMLTDEDRHRLREEKWLWETVQIPATDTVLQDVSGGEFPRPEKHDPNVRNKIGAMGAYALDVDRLARIVADVLDD